MTTTIELALKLAILESGLTQRQVAGRANISEKRLSDIVRCRTVATSDERLRIATVLGKGESSIFRRELEPEPKTGEFITAAGSRRQRAKRGGRR